MQFMNSKHTVFIASKHPVVRLGLQWCIASETCFDVVGEASDGLEAYSKIVLLEPEIVILDIVMPEIDTVELVHRLSLLGKPPKVILIADEEKSIDLDLVFESKVNGFFYKGIRSADFLFALNKVIENDYVYSKALFSGLGNENGVGMGIVFITDSQKDVIVRRLKHEDVNENECDEDSPLLDIMNSINVLNHGVLSK